MNALVLAQWIPMLLRQLPASWLRVLDAWSHGVARERARKRRQSWLRRRSATQAAPAQARHRLEPWRD